MNYLVTLGLDKISNDDISQSSCSDNTNSDTSVNMASAIENDPSNKKEEYGVNANDNADDDSDDFEYEDNETNLEHTRRLLKNIQLEISEEIDKAPNITPIHYVVSPCGRFLAYQLRYSLSLTKVKIYDFDKQRDGKNVIVLDEQLYTGTIAFWFSPCSTILLSLHESGDSRIWRTHHLPSGTTTSYSRVKPSPMFERSTCPFFEQFIHSGTFFSPDSEHFVFPSGFQIFIQKIVISSDPKKPVPGPVRIADGYYAVWSWR